MYVFLKKALKKNKSKSNTFEKKKKFDICIEQET
jgi:hypothetical protein